ncbi:MAG: pilus assembly protein PilP [Vicinamibacterales bacterium]
MMPLRCALIVATLAVAVHVAAQAPPAAASAPAQVAPAAPRPDLPTPPANFTYRSDGRRDPFMNLSRSGTVAVADTGASRPTGAAGIGVDELVVRGILQSRGAYVAMVSGPSGQTYTIRSGSRLYDGTVRSITAQAVVIQQQVSDPLSLQKQREVRKLLRVQEEGK